jgi:hypothetical protein
MVQNRRMHSLYRAGAFRRVVIGALVLGAFTISLTAEMIVPLTNGVQESLSLFQDKRGEELRNELDEG